MQFWKIIISVTVVFLGGGSGVDEIVFLLICHANLGQKNHSGYGLSQWETTLHCNIINREPWHYSEVTQVSWHLRSPATQLFVWQLVLANNTENIKSLMSQIRNPQQRNLLWVPGQIHWWPVNSVHKMLVILKVYPLSWIHSISPDRLWQCSYCTQLGNCHSSVIVKR